MSTTEDLSDTLGSCVEAMDEEHTAKILKLSGWNEREIKLLVESITA